MQTGYPAHLVCWLFPFVSNGVLFELTVRVLYPCVPFRIFLSTASFFHQDLLYTTVVSLLEVQDDSL